jgi:predicted secreted protein
MSAWVGRDVTVRFAIAEEDASVGSLTWLELGMVRAKNGPDVEWSSADTTADKSPQFTRTSLMTFKEVTFGGDGVAYDDAAYNQKVLKAHAFNPGSATANQPKVWWEITEPDGSQYVGPFILSSFTSAAPYDGEATFSFESTSNGAVTYTPA